MMTAEEYKEDCKNASSCGCCKEETYKVCFNLCYYSWNTLKDIDIESIQNYIERLNKGRL